MLKDRKKSRLDKYNEGQNTSKSATNRESKEVSKKFLEKRIQDLSVDDKLEQYQKLEAQKKKYLISQGIIIDKEKNHGLKAHKSSKLNQKKE